jgi:prepilin-type processing-associated H-X9-DG protein
MFFSRSPLLCMFLSFVVGAAPSLAVAQETEKFDASLLTDNTVLAGVAFPNRMIHSPGMELIPHELLKVASTEQMGVDATTIEQVQVAIDRFIPGLPPNFGIKIVLQQPLDLEPILEKLKVPTVAAEYNGKTYRRIDEPGPITVGIYQPDETSVVLGTEPIVQKVIDGNTAADNPAITNTLSKQGSKNDLMVILALDPMRDLINMGMQQTPPLPPQLEQFKKIPDLIRMAMLRVNVSGERPSGLIVAAHDQAEAEKLEKLIRKAFEIAKAQMFAQMAKDQNLQGQSPAMQKAMQAYSQRVSNTMLSAMMPTRKGKVLALESEAGLANPQVNIAIIGILVSMLLPAISSARQSARRAQSANNLRTVSIAQQMESNQNKDAISRAIMDKDGKPLLSWRVALLPYLEMNNLYKMFHLDEPWDSPHNIKLLSTMPAIYRSPLSKAGATKTNYLLAVGEGTLFPQYDVASFAQMARDGTSNTILFVEADDSHAVPWTKPADYNVKDLPKGLGNLYPGGFNAAFADTHVAYIPNDAELKWLRALFTPDGGEPVLAP